MGKTTIDRLIINSPYEEPARHWRYERETQLFTLADGRRPAGYVVASESSKAFDDPGIFVEIPLVNQIRPRVKAWREAGWPGVSSITKRLLDYWCDPEEFESRRFFFCQLEAVEALIWLTEAPAALRVGIDIPGDGGAFLRKCCKMATGSGKTVVMAMLIAWHILNKAAYPQDARFSRNILVIAPGLTVKNRLAVLAPAAAGNYYEEFRIVPAGMLDKLRQGKVLIRNWHALSWESEAQVKKRRSVDKRGVKSDQAYAREVLQEMATARNLLVINDEAHHAWRVNLNAEGKYLRARDLKDSAQEARLILVSSAGIIANIVVVFAAFLLLNILSPSSEAIRLLLHYLAQINTILAAFNLIPIPPLDGSKILMGFMSERFQYLFFRLEPYGLFIIIALLYARPLHNYQFF